MRIACLYTVENFVNAQEPLMSWTDVPYGIAMVAASLEQAGHEIKAWVFSPGTNRLETITEILKDFQAEAIAFTAVSSQFPFVQEIAKEIKTANPGINLILGGHHASLASQDAISCAEIDALCVGEGDHAAVAYYAQLAAGQRPTGVANFWIRQEDGSIEKNPTVPFDPNLDDLPFINRAHWSPWVHNQAASAVILLGRGCPYKCTYCSNHAIQKLAKGRFVRIRSVENVIQELAEISAGAPQLEEVYLEIETIGAFPKYLHELCAALAADNAQRKKPLRYGINITVTSKLVRDETSCRAMLSAMQKANFKFINFGIESGSEQMRAEVLKRPKYSNEELITFSRLAAEYEIERNVFVLIGLPHERVKEFKETKKVTRDCQPTRAYLGIFYPYPGTVLYDIAAENKLFDPKAIGSTAERSRAYLKLPGFPAWRIYFEYITFNAYVFKGQIPTLQLFLMTVWFAVKTSPRLHSLAKNLANSNAFLRHRLNQYRSTKLDKDKKTA